MSLKEGYQFLLYLSDGSRRCGYAQRNGEVKLQRKHYPINDLLGKPYGTVFEIQGKHLVPVDEPLIPVDATDVDINDMNDNRDLVDSIVNQTLQQEDIEKMRKDGVNGKIILKELASSSVTFEGKTDFSKKKYLKKKAEKYLVRCMLVENNSQTVCEQQYMKMPQKIKYGNFSFLTTSYLRFDTIAYILSVANIQSGQRIMVIDDCMGIVLSSVLERLGGYGLVFGINSNDNHIPSYDCINRLNLNVIVDDNTYLIDHNMIHTNDYIQIEQTRELTLNDYHNNIRNTLLIWHLDDLIKIQPYNHLTESIRNDITISLPNPQLSSSIVYIPTQLYHTGTGMIMKHNDGTSMTDHELINIYKKRNDRKQRDLWQPTYEQQEEMLRQGVHSLIIASNNPLDEVPLLLPYLALSGILVVYSQYQSLLAELFAGLKRSGQWVNITLSENFLRKYQVLPMRTHPYMNMYNNGGFILTATRVGNVNGPGDSKEANGIRTGAGFASSLKKKRVKLM